VNNAAARGINVVAAAGNGGPARATIVSPGAARAAITVGATADDDTIAEFSSRGPVLGTGEAPAKPDLTAPGVGICAARVAPFGAACIDGDHALLSGTSMAAPHVAGTAALIREAHPDWSSREIEAALKSSALDLGLPFDVQGYGRIQALAAASFDHAPPIAEIVTSASRLMTAIDIIGTATSSAPFDRYEISVGQGISPTSWQTMYESNAPVSGGVLLGGFAPTAVSDDGTTVRLVVFDALGLRSEDRAHF
jgi:subtilisin family serine protease